MSDEVVIYEPDNILKESYLSSYRSIMRELIDNRWLTYQLFKRNFTATYKQSLIGVFWTFIMPLVSIGTFIILNHSGVFNTGDIEVPYLIFALLGMTIWQIFSTGIVATANSLTSAGPMVTKINFSKKSLVLSSMGMTLVVFLFQISIIIILFVVYKIMPSKGIFLFPVVIVPLLLLVIGLGFILAPFNSIINDISRALNLIVTFLMFLTPVLYAKPKIGILTHITKFNPMYYFVSVGRDLILKGKISEFNGFIISSLISVVIFIVALKLFHLAETRVSERI
ncbi:MAG: ABC transporter permease [bacterium]